MAKGFAKNNPLDKLSVEPKTTVSVPDEEPKAAVEPKTTKKAEEPKEKRRVGRPKTKTEATKTINIAVPVSVLEKLDTVKVCYGNNLTQYINKLIEKDIAENYDKYVMIADNLNSFNN